MRTVLSVVRRPILVGLAAIACAVPAGLAAAAVTPSPATAQVAAVTDHPVLVDVRAAHHPGYDRVVFEYTGRGPGSYSAAYVSRLIADPAGWRLAVAGRAIIQVTMRDAQAHTATGARSVPGRTAFALKDVTSTVEAGDFEGVVTFGIGVIKKSTFHTHRLTNPARIVVDVTTPFTTTSKRVWFVDDAKVRANQAHPVTAVYRQVLPGTPGAGVMDRLYAGPTAAEKKAGLRFVSSLTTEWYDLRISSDGIARVQLKWRCGGGSAVATVADEVFPSLRQFPTVDHVKIYGPDGTTEYPTGHRDSIPECLEP